MRHQAIAVCRIRVIVAEVGSESDVRVGLMQPTLQVTCHLDLVNTVLGIIVFSIILLHPLMAAVKMTAALPTIATSVLHLEIVKVEMLEVAASCGGPIKCAFQPGENGGISRIQRNIGILPEFIGNRCPVTLI